MNMLLLKTLRDLRASLAQSTALVVVVLLGVASFVASVAAFRDLGTSYQRTYDQLRLADVTLSVQGAPESAADDLRRLKGVRTVQARLVVDTGLENPGGAAEEPIRARLIGVPAAAHPAVDDILILRGDYFSAGQTDVAIMESHFADYYHLNPGDTVSPILGGKVVPLRTSGIAASPEYLVVSPSKQEIFPSVRSFGVFFLPQSELQRLAGMDGMVNNFAVLLEPGADPASTVSALQKTLAPYGLLETTLQKDQPSVAALNADLEGFRELAYFMPFVILIVAAVSVYVMLGRQVRAQAPQIGLMKAIGYTDTAVLWHYLLFALVIGLLGAVLGSLLGLPLGYAITKSYALELGIPVVAARFYPELLAEGVLISLLATVLAAIGPARGALRQSPAQAMRLDPAVAQVKGRPSALERLLPLPLWLRLPLRNVLRVPRRSLTTALGIVFAYVLFLMVWGMVDSMNYFFRNNYTDVERWDLAVVFDSAQSPDVLAQIRGWTGVEKAEPLAQIPATLKSGAQTEDVLLTAVEPDQTLHGFRFPSGVSAESALGDGRLVLSTGLMEKFGLRAGDRVTLDTPLGPQDFTLGPPSDELMNTIVYLSLDELQKRAGTPVPPINAYYLTVDGARSAQIKTELYHLPGAVSVQRKADVVADLQSYMVLFYAFMGVMVVFALLMAFALLFNAMTVGVLERKREFATMRSLGTGRRWIALLLSGESLILWLFTLVPGLLSGYLMALGMGSAFSTDLFTFKIVIAPVTYVAAAGGILLTMLLAALPAVRRVNRLNLAEATKVLT
jgi:putative ABC transport system permease protein